MNYKIQVELNGVQKTLLLPLWARAKESRELNPIIYDQTACDLLHNLDYNFSEIESNMNKFTEILFLARAKTFDDAIKSFIKRYPKAVIINLGAGLDTTFSRVDNGTIFWYDIDLPDVIELRRKLIPESEREKYIAKSFFDTSWFEDIEKNYDNILFIAGGVFIYFDEECLKDFFDILATKFPNGEMIFDAASRFGNYISNKTIEKAKLGNARLKLVVKNKKMFEKWSNHIKVQNVYKYFNKIKPKGEWGIKTILQIICTDLLNISNIYEIKFVK